MSNENKNSSDNVERLKELAQLKENGDITEEEYKKLKKELLNEKDENNKPEKKEEEKENKEKMKKGCGCFLIILIIIVASVLLVNNDNKNQQTKKSVEIKQTSLKNYEILDKTINYEYKDNVYGSKYKILVKTPLKKLDKNDIYNFVNNFRGEAKYKDYVIVYLYSTKKAYLEGKNDNYTKAYDYGFLGLYHSSNNNFKWMQAKGKFSDMMGESVSL